MNGFSNLESLLKPKSIAVVGASEKFGAGSLVIKNLQALGFSGRIIPINPGYQTVLSLPCYPSLAEVPEDVPVDCAAIVLGGARLMPVLEQAAAKKVKGAWAFASGFAETGAEGRAAQEQLRGFCFENDIRFCGPNCVGFVNMHERAAMFSAPISPTLEKGPIAAVAQSGSVILALANSNRGLGYSALVSSGNEAVLDMADYIEYFLDDDRTRVIMAFIEGVRRPEAFQAACRRAADLGKPIVAVKVGRSELARRTTTTHTGALAGSDEVYDAFFRQNGVIRVDDLDQLMETAELLAYCGRKLPAGNRVGMITVSGGEIGLIGDQARDLDLDFSPLPPEVETALREKLPAFTSVGNPLDGWGSGDLKETYPACLEILAQGDHYDLVAVSQDSPPGMSEEQVAQYSDVARAAVRAARGGKPVLAFSHVSTGLDPTIKGILNKGGVPLLQGGPESLRAMHHLIGYARFRRGLQVKKADSLPRTPEQDAVIAVLSGRTGPLTYQACRELLAAFDLDQTREKLVRTPEDAIRAATDLGWPVALKGVSAGLPHKTEAGVVMLNLGTEAELKTAFDQILKNAAAYDPGLELEGVLVQQMASPESVEAIVGVVRDPVLGPAVLVGLGGIMVEVVKDFRLALPPFDEDQARELIEELQGARLLHGFRGRPEADVEALAGLMTRVGRLAFEMKEVLVSMDLNPVMVSPRGRGVRIVDMVIETGHKQV